MVLKTEKRRLSVILLLMKPKMYENYKMVDGPIWWTKKNINENYDDQSQIANDKNEWESFDPKGRALPAMYAIEM